MNSLIGSPLLGYDWRVEPWETMVWLLQMEGMTLACFTSEVSAEEMRQFWKRWRHINGFWVVIGKETALIPNRAFIYGELYPWLFKTCGMPPFYFRNRDKRQVTFLWCLATRFLQKWNFVLVVRLLETRCIRIDKERDTDLISHLMWPNNTRRYWALVRLLLDYGLRFEEKPTIRRHELQTLQYQRNRDALRRVCCVLLVKSPLILPRDVRRLIAQMIWQNRWRHVFL